MNEKMKEIGQKTFWAPPEDATPEQIAEMEARGQDARPG